MNSRNLLIHNIGKKLLLLTFLVLQSAFIFAQDVTISGATGGVSASPLVGGSINQAIFGIQFDKAGGGTNAVTGLTIKLTQDPTGRFLNARLFRSTDNTYDGGDSEVATGTFSNSPNSIIFSGSFTTFGGASGATTRSLFLVVDIDPAVSGATAPVVPSATNAEVSVANNTVLAATVTGTSFSFTDSTVPAITFSPTAGAVNVAVASNLIISFDEAIRNINDSDIDNANVGSLLTFKLTNAGGADVPFTATINAGDDQIIIDPTSNLNPDQVYYLNIAPVEDASNNATAAANITFTTIDTQPPVPTFNPLNGATGVVETNNIVISFNEAIRRASDDFNLDNTTIDGRITLKITDASGANIPFDATINAGDDQVTIDPTSALPGNTIIYVAIAGVEDSNDNLINPDPTSITFTTGDTQPPSLTFNPANSATGVSVSSNLTITFTEAIRNLDDSPISGANLLTLVNLKLTNAGGADVPFTASIDGTNTIVTIDPASNLTGNQVYFVRMNPVEDGVNNAASTQSITFTSEAPPSFNPGPFAPSTTCVGDDIIISGNNFGAAVPTVTVNGTPTTPAEIIAHSNTSITFKTLAGMAGTSQTVTVLNNTSGLSSTSVSTVTINPAINPGLSVSANPTSSFVGSNSTIQIANTQSTVSYQLRQSSPGAPFNIGNSVGGNGGTLAIATNTLPGGSNYSTTGTYIYQIRATSSGCTTVTLTNTATVTVASLNANAGSDKTICNGEDVTLGGSPSSVGGSGFYSYSWNTVPPSSVFSTSSNPTISPIATRTYRLTVNDGSGNPVVTDDVLVTVNQPADTAQLEIFLNPTKPNNTYLKSDGAVQLTYKLNGVAGTFSGQTRFEGPGVNSSGFFKYFYPSAANYGNDTISLYHENSNGCITPRKYKIARVVDSNNLISGLQPSYCQENFNNPLIINNPSQPANASTFFGYQYTYKNQIKLIDEKTGMEIFPSVANGYTVSGTSITLNPSKFTPGPKRFDIVYDITYYLFDGVNSVFWFTSGNYTLQSYFSINEQPVVATNFEPTYCENAGLVKLKGSPSGGTFSVNGSSTLALTTIGPDTFFDPSNNSLPNNITMSYTYTSPFTTCSATSNTSVEILRIPAIDFTFTNACEGDTVQFTPSFPLSTIKKYSFSFGDGGVQQVDSDIPTSIEHQYLDPKNYQVIMATLVNNGCTDTIPKNLLIGKNPKFKYSWANVCEGQSTQFTTALEGNFNTLEVQSMTWNFGEGSPSTNPGFIAGVSHLYTATGNYNSTLTITSTTGCTIQKNQEVYIVKHYKGAQKITGLYPYKESFDLSNDSWVTGGTNSSWEWSTPAGTLINRDSSDTGLGKVWITNADGSYNSDEHSWVHSPCFDLTALERPVLSMDIRLLTDLKRDGAVLQVNTTNNTDGDIGWNTIGDVGDGLEWYNTLGIAGSPGGQALKGWSGSKDFTSWRTASIPLDNYIPALGSPLRQAVRFRIAFGSQQNVLADPSLEGFAFDNFNIDQRNRIVLVEQFTNNGGINSPTEPNKKSNAEVNTFIALPKTTNEIIKLEYHIGRPGPNIDNIYQDNETDANARAAFYGITSTPSTLIDAGNGDGIFSNWANKRFDSQSLLTSKISFDSLTTPNTPVDKLNVKVKFTALQNLPSNTSLHIAAVEKVINHPDALGTNGETSFTYVMKKLIPDATGIKYNDVILKNEVKRETVSWSPSAYDLNQLSIVVFLQNEDTKEIYQARFLQTPTYIPPADLITGAEPLLADQITIYPNPAKDEVNIELPRPYSKSLPVKVVDAFGREVYNASFNIGEQKKTVKTSEFASGVYIIQIKSATGEVVRKKVIISN